jgi:hypothetical protein
VIGWTIALDVILWVAAAVLFFGYGQWIIALIFAILALVLLFILTAGNLDFDPSDASDIFDIFD